MRDQLLDEITKVLGWFKIVMEPTILIHGHKRILIEFPDDDLELRLSRLADNFPVYQNELKPGTQNPFGDLPNFFIRNEVGIFLGTVYAAPDFTAHRTFTRNKLVVCYDIKEEDFHTVHQNRVDYNYKRKTTSFIEQRYIP